MVKIYALCDKFSGRVEMVFSSQEKLDEYIRKHFTCFPEYAEVNVYDVDNME